MCICYSKQCIKMIKHSFVVTTIYIFFSLFIFFLLSSKIREFIKVIRCFFSGMSRFNFDNKIQSYLFLCSLLTNIFKKKLYLQSKQIFRELTSLDIRLNVTSKRRFCQLQEIWVALFQDNTEKSNLSFSL